MKIFYSILIVYILVLGLMPCVDYLVQLNENGKESSSSHSHEHGALDLCSPFCTCQCCQVSATDFKITTLKVIVPFVSILPYSNFFYFLGSGVDCSNTLLQPPKS